MVALFHLRHGRIVQIDVEGHHLHTRIDRLLHDIAERFRQAVVDDDALDAEIDRLLDLLALFRSILLTGKDAQIDAERLGLRLGSGLTCLPMSKPLPTRKPTTPNRSATPLPAAAANAPGAPACRCSTFPFPDRPRKIGELNIDGVGFHRLWYVGGRYAFASALFDGFTDYIFVTIDMADPTRPEIVGRWWLPGMNKAAGETSNAPDGKRYALHHALVSGDTAYACWRDSGLTLLDIKDHANPKLIAHRNWSPPFGGGTHSPLPLPGRDLLVVADEAVLDHEEDGRKHTWIFDIREPANPVSISTFPIPSEADYVAKGGHFGPHNLHENRPGSFVSETLIFATWQNAGIRAFDITDPSHPRETGALVPAGPTEMTDRRAGRPRVIQSADVFVDAAGIIYATDYNAGLAIIEYGG